MSELVLDLTRLLPGPLCSKILQSLGFQVLRLLPPGGDWLEPWAPEAYAWLQDGKQHETVNLKMEAGRSRLRALAAQASVLIENGLPGRMEGWGVGPEQLRALNPKLVYIRIGGYRDSSVHAAPGHDLTYLAGAGLLSHLDPAWKTIPFADLCGGFWGAIAALQGLRAHGGFFEVYLEEAPLAAGWPSIPGLDGSRCSYAVYAAADGQVALAALEPHLWERFCTAADRPEWRGGAFTPAAPGHPVADQIADLFRSRTAGEWDDWAREHLLPLRAVHPPSAGFHRPPWSQLE